MEDFSTIITRAGQIRQALLLQGQQLELAYFAVGDSNGVYSEPDEAQTALVNEVWRGAITNIYTDPDDPTVKVVTAYIPANVGGWWIREAGLFTNDDPPVLFAVGKVPAREKVPSTNGASSGIYIKMHLDVGSDVITVIPGVETIYDVAIYDPDGSYKVGDKISFFNSVFVCLYPTVPGQSPFTNPDFWQALPAKGDKGEKGDMGPSGALVGETDNDLTMEVMFAAGYSMVIRTDYLIAASTTAPPTTAPPTTAAPTTTASPQAQPSATISMTVDASPVTTTTAAPGNNTMPSSTIIMSIEAPATTTLAPPTAPTGGYANPGVNSITLNPGISGSGAASYKAYYTMDGSTPTKSHYNGTILTLQEDTESVINGLTPGVTFKFVFTAFNGANQTGTESVVSAVVTASPTATGTTTAAPTTAAPTTAGPTTTGAPTTTAVIQAPTGGRLDYSGTTLTFHPGTAQGAASYKAYITYDGRNPTKTDYDTVSIGVTDGQTLGNANAATAKCVYTACTGTGGTGIESSASSVYTADTVPSSTITMVLANAPAAPANVSVSSGDGSNTVTWDAVGGATSYNLYWTTNGNLTANQMVSGSATKVTGASSGYQHTALANSTPYYYVITAVNANGESNPSAIATGTPTATQVSPTATVVMSIDNATPTSTISMVVN